MTESTIHPTFWEAFKFWFKLGFISFGGPTGQISIMYQELVEKRKWISNNRFLHALNFCMCFRSGGEAVGHLYRLAASQNTRRVIAGSFFVIPSIFILFGLSYVYVPSEISPGLQASLSA